MSHVFISYARKDGREHAERLDADLHRAGYRAWLDRRGIDPTKDFTAEIESAIRAASHVVVCITPDTERPNSFVRREVEYALLLDKPIYVAKMVANCLPPINIITHTYFEFYKDWDAAFAELCSYLARPATSYAQPAPAAPAHPLRPYVQRLLDSAAKHLETAIIKLIDLEISETPDAVPAPPLDMIEMLFEDARGETSFTSFDAAFKHFNRRALLLGEPGAGKTVTLMATARQAAADWLSEPDKHPLPVLGIIATWDASKQPPLMDWLGAQKGLTPDALRGNTLLLLDGLDELGGERTNTRPDGIEERYDPRQRFISALNAHLGSNHALVTCRVADYEAVGQQVALDGAVTLQRLTDAQMRVYLADLPDLQAAIDADDGLREMARTPLLLSYLAFGFRDRPEAVKELHDLREGALRDAIFIAYMEKRYDREVKRLAKQGKEPPFTLEFIRETLGRLAMENAGGMWRRGSNFRSRHEANILERQDFALVVPENQMNSYITFCCDLHFLHQRSEGVGFIHLHLRDTLVYGYSLPWIRQSDLYSSIYEPNPAVALGTIRDSRILGVLLSLLEGRSVDSLLRACVADALGRLGDIRAVEPLIRVFGDVDEDVRSSAAASLGQIGDVRAVEPLVHALDDKHWVVRRSAVFALGQIGDARAVEPLIRTLGDKHWVVQARAAYTLGQIGDVRAVEPLIRTLGDENEEVRRSAVYTLGTLGDVRAVEPLIRTLGDENCNSRQLAAKSLGQIGDSRAVMPLIHALEDVDYYVYYNAAVALRQIDTSAVEPLIHALGHMDAAVRRNAAYTLGEIGDVRAVELLILALGDSDWDVRCSAEDALERIGTPEALEAVGSWRKRKGLK